jgi:hypothetical protein
VGGEKPEDSKPDDRWMIKEFVKHDREEYIAHRKD